MTFNPLFYKAFLLLIETPSCFTLKAGVSGLSLKGFKAMQDDENLKPSYDEWMYWTQVVVDRLTTVTHVYGKPPHGDVFISEKERQAKLSETVEIMRHLHQLTDAYELSIPSGASDVAELEEKLIATIQPEFRDVLTHLPVWSADMQRLLKSPWVDGCPGLTARALFRGPDGRLAEGIGSGMPENGRLPEVITELLDREAAGGDRAPRVEKPRFAEPRMRREELARLWGKKNGSFLRSAGRMD